MLSAHNTLQATCCEACVVCCRRLADALDGGVASLATKPAVEALHAVATRLPTSRDLILATGAVTKLVTLLQSSLLQAHYAMIKVEAVLRLHAILIP